MTESKFTPLLTPLEQALSEATPSECPLLIGELERLKAIAWAKTVSAPSGDRKPSRSPGYTGRWLTAEEAAKIFPVTLRWLYRHKKRLPHSQPSRKKLLFPEDKLRSWFENKH